jgi:transcriptional regulator with XRE-family HTH domain
MAADKEQSKLIARQFGRNLREVRHRAGISQESLSVRASLHRTEIGLLERGTRVPRIDTLLRLALALGVSPEELLDGLGWPPVDAQAARAESSHDGRSTPPPASAPR